MRKETKQNAELEMRRADDVIRHPLFVSNLERLEELEADRIWCCHGFGHLMDVARLAYIFTLERGYELPKDFVYATALLHDIGRSTQYLEGIPHAEAGIEPAAQILTDCGFTEAEIAMALRAIAEHSDESDADAEIIARTWPDKVHDEQLSKQLREVLYDGDKLSRDCFRCKVADQCDWAEWMKKRVLSW
ncbi:MAG: HD domain-containing protein [Firmicutes bacterium]|nr:HD domain-containing protein [Bacillota bacterium]